MIHHNNIRSAFQRGTAFAAAVALVVAAVVPATSAFADSLNPLTDRSLTLSSSSPGWSSTDGSGNTTYAPPNSGANGFKTGNYFDFKVSSSATVKGFSFQYCTTSAGNCYVPGNDTVRGTDDIPNQKTDLRIVYPSAAEIADTAGAGTITVTSGDDQVTGSGTSFLSFLKAGGLFTTVGGNTYTVKSVESNTSLTLTANAGTTESGVTYTRDDFKTVVDTATGAVKVVPGYTNSNPKYQAQQNGKGDLAEAAKFVGGNFIVMYDNAGTWTQSTGWTIGVIKHDDGAGDTENYITLTNSTGQAFTPGQEVKVLFFATNDNYITNPGANEFFVKINTWDDDTLASGVPTGNIIDGGVTVANVVNQSIQITTKVLETMQFSVGTIDPNTLDSDSSGGPSEMDTAYGTAQGATKHTPCDTILRTMDPSDPTKPANVLQLGDQNAESSLSTTHTYSTHSYWRLSSNSSAGATVYYSGHTLSNTVGDEIDAIGPTKATPAKGAEQFGLALDNTSNWNGSTSNDTGYGADTSGTPAHQNYSVDYAQEYGAGYENAADNGRTSIHTASLTADNVLSNASWHAPRLYPLVAQPNYNDGTGAIDSSPTTQFAFDPMSDTIPVALATEETDVVDCVTGKVRYIANIAATTPAGIYTTKVNYIAAPQY